MFYLFIPHLTLCCGRVDDLVDHVYGMVAKINGISRLSKFAIDYRSDVAGARLMQDHFSATVIYDRLFSSIVYLFDVRVNYADQHQKLCLFCTVTAGNSLGLSSRSSASPSLP